MIAEQETLKLTERQEFRLNKTSVTVEYTDLLEFDASIRTFRVLKGLIIIQHAGRKTERLDAIFDARVYPPDDILGVDIRPKCDTMYERHITSFPTKAMQTRQNPFEFINSCILVTYVDAVNPKLKEYLNDTSV